MTTPSTHAEAPAAAPQPRRKHSVAAYRGADVTDPYIYTSKTVWMQRVVDVVKTGPPLYVTGSVPLGKVPSLLQKFAKRYVLNAPRMTDARARKALREVARWIGYYDERHGEVRWILFYWPGEHLCKEERWRVTGKDRIEHSGYEVVKLTRPGAKRPALTWRYTREQYQKLRDDIVHAIRTRQDKILDQLIHSTARTPGFAGSRAQVKNLWKLVRDEWKRVRGKKETPPAIPAGIGYVRRLPDKGELWSNLVSPRKAKKGAKRETSKS